MCFERIRRDRRRVNFRRNFRRASSFYFAVNAMFRKAGPRENNHALDDKSTTVGTISKHSLSSKSTPACRAEHACRYCENR